MAERKVQELLGQMQKTLECSICLELMTNPVSTPCGHQFCRFCLMEFLERKRQVPCPLCKKVITKRSLIDRSQLGEMVTCVKTLIAAFQADTGSLFSPPRGPAASVLPGTPETIQSKGPRKTPSSGRSNVRRSTRKHSYDNLDEVDGSPADNQSRNAAGENVGLEKRYPQRGGTAKDQITDSMVLRQQELLKHIEEGTHYAKEAVEDSVEKLTSCGTEENSTSGIETTYSDESSKNSSVKRQITKDLQRNQCLQVAEDESLVVNNKEINGDNDLNIKTYVGKNEIVNNKEIVSELNTDKGNDILSGTSVGILSEASSGPLFKSPLEKEKIGKKKSAFEALQFETNNEVKRSLRSREKAISYSESVDAEVDKNDETTDPLATQDPLVVKEMGIQQTYSRKHKEVHEKNKKTTKKVEEWLKNIPEDTSNKKDLERIGESNIERLVQQENKTMKNGKLSKRKLKILEEEKAMGMKLKHLAQQVLDKPNGLLFDFDEFDNESGTKESTGKVQNEKKRFKTNNFEDKSESEKSKANHLNNHKNDTKECEATDSMTVSEEDSTICKEVKTSENTLLEVGTNDSLPKISKTGLETERISITNRKRIFKTKGTMAKQMFSINNVQDDSKKIEMTNNVKEKNELQKNSNEKNLFSKDMKEIELPNSDPYEFKSSQNTPKKVKKKQNPKKKNNENSKKNNTVVKESVEADHNNLKTWNKDMVPDKTILKNSKEINTIQANLKEAEEYDLVTCTQEAAAHIAEQQKKQGSRKSDPTGTMFKEGKKSDCAQKRVRFSEPVIADFTKPGKIDLLAYRKAKEQFHATACSKENGTVTVNLNKRELREDDQQNKERENVKGNKVVEEAELSAEEDSESDDLSEDYRFHDDSSGTDDLEIEPTQEQFEKPNIEIQPDEIKSRLSQELSQQLILETQVIPVNKDSPEVTIVEETPALFAVPKFKRSLSKLGHKSNMSELKRKNGCSAKLNTDAKIDSTASYEKPQLNITKGQKQLKTRGNVKENNLVNTPETGPSVTVIAETPLLQNVKLDQIDQNIDLDSPAIDTDTSIQKYELGILEKELRNEINIRNDSLPACKQNQVTNAADLKKASISSLDFDETQSPDEKIIETVDTEDPAVKESSQELVGSEQTSSQDSESILHPKVSPAKQTCSNVIKKDRSTKGLLLETENDDKVEKTISTEHVDSVETKSVKTDNNDSTVTTKKKRKSFTLEEEESLDFGSLSKDMADDVEENTQGSAKKAKRQRLNRHGSPRSKNESSQLKKEPSIICSIDGVKMSKDNGKSDDEMLGSTNAIPDTVYLVSDEADSTQASGKNRCDLHRVPSVEIISPESVEFMEINEKKSIVNVHNKHHNELNGSSEFTNPTEKSDTRLTHRLKKNKTDKRSVKQQMSCANNSGLELANSPVEEDDVTRIRHLSGLLVSPSSQGLFAQKGSPENIFEMDSVLPSVDFSPVDNVDKPGSISPSLVLELLSNMESVDEAVIANEIDSKTVGASDHRIKESNKEILAVSYKEQDLDRVQTRFTSSKNLTKSDTVGPEKELECEIEGDGLNLDSSVAGKKTKVKAVRGFAKKKRVSGICPSVSSTSGPSSDGSVISETPLSLDSTKHKTPVSKITLPLKRSQSGVQHTPESVCILDSKDNTVETAIDIDTYEDTSQEQMKKDVKNSNHKNTNSPSVKSITKINATKYSPMLRKQQKKVDEKCKEFMSEVVELKTYKSDDEEDMCILSPNELPDLDDFRGKTPDKVKNNGNIKKTNSPHINTGRSKSRFPTVSDQKENVHVTNKVENESEQGVRDAPTVEEQNTIPETVSEIESDFEMQSPHRSSVDSEIPEFKEESHGDVLNELNHEHIEVDDADNSIHSSTSSEFRLDSSSDEESPEKQAVNEMSKFDKIAQNISGNNSNDKKGDTINNKLNTSKKGDEMKDKHSSTKKKHGKGNEISKPDQIERICSKQLSPQVNVKNKQKEILARGEKKWVIPESEDIYSSRLDSSPLSSPLNHDSKTESEAIIMESDVEENVETPRKCHAYKLRKGKSVEGENFKNYARGVDEKSIKEMRKSSKMKEKDNRYAAIDSDSDEEEMSNSSKKKVKAGMCAVIESDSDKEEETAGCGKEVNIMYAAIDSDSDDEEETVVRRKGIKRAILSDSSSEEEDDSSRHMNLTSSSAFSSQSENLTTQERIALEKEVERMAKEMELMKEQLKRNKQLNAEKNRAAVVLDDSDQDHIDDDHSDVELEQDLFMSQPSMDLHDSPPQQAETVPGSVGETEMHLESDASLYVTYETIQPSNNAETLPPEIMTVPDSEPSQSLRNIESCAAAELELSQSVQPTPDETVETSECVQPSPDNTIEPSTLEHLSQDSTVKPSMLEHSSQDNTVKPSEPMQDTEMSEDLVRSTLSQQLAKPALPFLETVAKPSPVHNMKSRLSQSGKSVLGESVKLVEGDSRRTQDSTRPVLGKVDTNTKIESSSVLLDYKPSSAVSDPVSMQKASAEVDTNVGETPKPGSKRNVGIVVTGLNQSQVQQTKKLAVLNEAKFFSKFNNSVTHVVVKPSEEDDLICDRTLKFFQGIARKCWIVNYFWVSDSRQVGYLLPEGPYEIQGDTANNESHFGPKRSRSAIGDKLFDRFEVALIGDNEFLSKDSLQDLIETCGGRVLDIAHVGQGHTSILRGQGQRVAMVISCTDLEEGDEEQDLIVRQSRDIYKGLGLVTVTREWVLDSLTMYRIQPLEDYVITDIANLKLPQI